MEIINRGDICEWTKSDLPERAKLAGIDQLIIPSFFLGLISQQPDVYPIGDILPEGQFLFTHQYNGHSCSQAHLRGIFMPICLITDARIRDGLKAISARYGLNSLLSPDGLLKLQQDFNDLGAPDARALDYTTGTAEGLIRFDAQSLLDWLRPIAPYIQEFSGLELSEIAPIAVPDDAVKDACAVSGYPPEKVRQALESRAVVEKCAASRKVSKAAPLEWYGLEEFKPWLSGYGKLPLRSSHWNGDKFEIKEDDIVGAFVYPNGD
jgi:hypothetical protein